MRLRVPSIQTSTWFRDAASAINLLLGDIPEGGTTGQVLAKTNADDFDLEWKTVSSLTFTLANHADDAAAATGGIAVGQLYRNGSVVMVRVA